MTSTNSNKNVPNTTIDIQLTQVTTNNTTEVNVSNINNRLQDTDETYITLLQHSITFYKKNSTGTKMCHSSAFVLWISPKRLTLKLT